MEQSTGTIELWIAVTEEMVRELLWHALAPEALVMTSALNKAITQQRSMRGISLEGYTLSGISITGEADTMRAELSYMQMRVPTHPSQKDRVITASEDSFPASDSPAWTGSEVGSVR